jgi:hypothetical protein
MSSSRAPVYRCVLPSQHRLDNTAGCFSGLDQVSPVIVFLSPMRLSEWLDRHREPFYPSTNRMARVDETLVAGRLMLGIIGVEYDGPRVFDGRHRLLALDLRGIAAIPFLTDASMAAELKDRFGTRDGLDRFDLAGCVYPVV